MSETPVIREGTSEDLAQIVPLFLQSVDTSIPGVTFSDSRTYAPADIDVHFRSRLFPPRTLKLNILKLPSTGEIVAYANVKPAPTEEQKNGGGSKYSPSAGGDQDEVDMFFVKAGLGGRGYGGLLLEAIQKDWAGLGGLQLHVFKTNARAIRFYEKAGFQMVPGAEAEWDLAFEEEKKETVCLMSWMPSS